MIPSLLVNTYSNPLDMAVAAQRLRSNCIRAHILSSLSNLYRLRGLYSIHLKLSILRLYNSYSHYHKLLLPL